MASIPDKIYRHLPTAAQHLVVSAYGAYWNRLRFGGRFRYEVQAFQHRERFSAEDWNAYVLVNLRQLLTTAFTRVPYYREAWKGLVTLDQLLRFKVEDLPALPPLEKRIARDNPEMLLIDGKRDRRDRVFHTSGSTGTPVKTFWLPEEIQRSLALREARSCRFADVSYTLPRATFSGRMVVPDPDSNGPYYRFNLIERQVYFSAFHLSPHTVADYVRALKRHHVLWMTGYSNSLYQLAQLALDQGLELPVLKAVVSTSEKVTMQMRHTIEQAFRTRLFEEYGTVEDAFYVCENEFGEKLVSPDAGLIEVVDQNFQPVPAGELGEVLATGFIRPHQPLIRYRIGDMAILSDQSPSCGRNMPVLQEVVGRLEDTVYGPDGRRLLRFHGIFVDQPFVREGQIIQDSLDHIRVRVVPKPGFSTSDEEEIVRRIQQRLSSAVKVTIERVERIERTRAGKFKAVISNLSDVEREKVVHK